MTVEQEYWCNFCSYVLSLIGGFMIIIFFQVLIRIIIPLLTMHFFDPGLI